VGQHAQEQVTTGDRRSRNITHKVRSTGGRSQRGASMNWAIAPRKQKEQNLGGGCQGKRRKHRADITSLMEGKGGGNPSMIRRTGVRKQRLVGGFRSLKQSSAIPLERKSEALRPCTRRQLKRENRDVGQQAEAYTQNGKYQREERREGRETI